METKANKQSPTETRQHNDRMISRACVELQKILLEAQINNREGLFGVTGIVRDGKIKSLRRMIEQNI